MTTYRPPPLLGQRLLCGALFLAGLAAMSLTAAMNADLGRSLASTDYGSTLQGGAALNVDILFALLALAAGVLLNRGRWLAGSGVAVVAALFGLYSLSGVVGFGARERVAKARTAEVTQERIDAAARQANADARHSKGEHIAWLKATLVEARSQAERARLLEQIAEATNKPLAVQVAPIANAMPDAQASVLASFGRDLGVRLSVEDVQIGLIGGLALLLIVGKGLAFGLSTALWPSRADPAIAAKIVAAEEVEPAAPPVPAPLPQPMRPIDAAQPPHEAVDLARAREVRAVREFFNQEIVAVGEKAKVKATVVYHWFQTWARGRGIEGMSQTQFGRIVTDQKLAEKQNDGRHVFYRGVTRAQQELATAA